MTKLTQFDFAEKIQYTHGMISEVECEKKKPPLLLLTRIAGVFKVDLEILTQPQNQSFEDEKQSELSLLMSFLKDPKINAKDIKSLNEFIRSWWEKKVSS